MSTGVAAVANPIATSVLNVDRAWIDAGKNYIPGCDLRNFGANGECGPISDVNFGKSNPRATRYADDLIRGFGTRDYLWDVAAELQHQLRPGVSILGGYYRNWTDHYGLGLQSATGTTRDATGWPTGVTDNLAVTPVDFSPYCITAPVDSRLPGGGGYQVCGLYDIVPAKFGVGETIVARASAYGKGRTRHADFFTASISTRFGEGIDIGGSLDTGRIVDDQCFVVDSPQSLVNCRVVVPFKSQVQVKMHGSYPLPGAFVVSGVFQSVAGIPYVANYSVPNAEIKPSLGRNLAACGTRAVCTATATVPLIVPYTQFEPRRILLDLRMSKVFSVGPKMRLRANVDLYNVLNSSSLVDVNSNYGANWRQPQGGAVQRRPRGWPLVAGRWPGDVLSTAARARPHDHPGARRPCHTVVSLVTHARLSLGVRI